MIHTYAIPLVYFAMQIHRLLYLTLFYSVCVHVYIYTFYIIIHIFTYYMVADNRDVNMCLLSVPYDCCP